jgi:hypothetical protein
MGKTVKLDPREAEDKGLYGHKKLSRQQRRAMIRQMAKGNVPATHRIEYMPVKRKSKAGVVYKDHKRVVVIN